MARSIRRIARSYPVRESSLYREIIFQLLLEVHFILEVLARLKTQNRSNIRVIEFPAGFLP